MGHRHGFRQPPWLIPILYASGFLHWLLFFKLGKLTFRAFDWGKEYIYYSLLKQWIETGRIPYHIDLAFHGTHRFLAIPEVNLSPQILLLPLVQVGTFVVINTILLYSIGFIGCLLIKQRYRLGIASFTLLFLIFNFNGHLIAHIGVGHSMWAGYFLLPFYFLYLLELIGDKPGRAPYKIALVSLMSLGFIDHSYLWSVARLERIHAKRVVDLTIPALISRSDPHYKGLLWISLVITLITVVLLVRSLATRRRKGNLD